MHKFFPLVTCLAPVFTLLGSCASPPQPAETTPSADQTPPANIQAWMDRLTVQHVYDPETGFIVAQEVVTLPPVLSQAPSIEEAVRDGRRTGRPVVVFATADRCAPCQQFKLDALNNPAVIRRLESPDVVATHVEVDREQDAAVRILGSAGIPVSYVLVDGEVTSQMAGQRSAKELIAWLEGSLGDG